MILVERIPLAPTAQDPVPLPSERLLRFLAKPAVLAIGGPLIGGVTGWVAYAVSGGDIGVAGFTGVMIGIVPLSVGLYLLLGTIGGLQRFESESRERSRLDAQAGYLESIRVTGIVEVIEVYDLEDFGPGFLVDAGDAELLYLADQNLNVDEEGNLCCTDGIRVSRTPVSLHLQSAESRGRPKRSQRHISVAALSEAGLLDEHFPSCILIPRDQFPWGAVEEF